MLLGREAQVMGSAANARYVNRFRAPHRYHNPQKKGSDVRGVFRRLRYTGRALDAEAS